MEEQAQNKQIGAIAVHSQYIKDLSLEISDRKSVV